jgi:prefoldin subunit 5
LGSLHEDNPERNQAETRQAQMQVEALNSGIVQVVRMRNDVRAALQQLTNAA